VTTKDFLWRLKLHVDNWNEWPLVLSASFSVLSGGSSGWRQWLDDSVHDSVQKTVHDDDFTDPAEHVSLLVRAKW